MVVACPLEMHEIGLQQVSVQKQQRPQRPVLGGGAPLLLHGQVAEKVITSWLPISRGWR